MLFLLIANDVFLTRIVVVGSVPGQEGGSEPSKGGNGGGSFSGQVTRGWMQAASGRWLLGEQVECSGACHRLGAALHLELTVDGIDIRFDGAQCQDEPGCNRAIGEARRNEAQYFQFALGQRFEQRLGRSWCRGCSRGGPFLNPFSAQQCEEPFNVGQGNVRQGGARSFPRMFVELCEQNRHGWAFIHKDSNVALRLSQHQSAFQWHKSSRDVALHLVSEGL